MQPRTKKWLRAGCFVLSAVGLLIVVVVFVAYDRYRRGYVPSFAYRDYVADDGSCRGVLTDNPYHMPLSAEPNASWRDGMWVVALVYLSRVESEFGWFNLPTDLPPARAATILEELRRWHSPRLLHESVVEGETAVQVDGHNGIEVRMSWGATRFVARYILARTGPKPRLYYVSVGGPNFDPDGEAARKVLDSFHITQPGK